MSQLSSGIGGPNLNTQTPQQPFQGGVFPGQFTQQAGNLASALATRGHNDYYRQNAQLGLGSGSGVMQAGIGRDMGLDQVQAQFAPQQLGLQHGFANAQQNLQQQQAQDREAQQWAGLGLQNQQFGNQMALQQQGNLFSLLLGAGLGR